MELSHIEDKMNEWHRLKHGTEDVDIKAAVEKFGEECGEFMAAILEGEPSQVGEEAFDVLATMTHIVRHYGYAGLMDAAAHHKLRMIFDRLKE